MLHGGGHTGQVTAVLTTVLLRILPCVSPWKQPVAVAMELLPAVLTSFSVYGGKETKREREREREGERKKVTKRKRKSRVSAFWREEREMKYLKQSRK